MNIYPRSSWTSSPLRATTPQATQSGYGVHWEGPHMGPYSAERVPAILRGIEDYHRRNGWSDIAYNFIVDRFGRVWEGRGWNVRNGANGNGTANASFRAICYLGGEGDGFTVEARSAIVSHYHAHRARGGDPETRPHRGFVATACPGDAITTFVLDVLPYTGLPDLSPAAPPAVNSRRRKALSTMRSTLRPGSGPGRFVSDLTIPEAGDRVICRRLNPGESGPVTIQVIWGNGNPSLVWNGSLGNRGDGQPFDAIGAPNLLDRFTAPAPGLCSVVASHEVVLDLDPRA